MSLAKRLARYDEEAKRAKKVLPPSPPKPKCKCEDNQTLKELSPFFIQDTKNQADCICKFLDAYAGFATETKKTDADVDALYKQARELAYAGMGAIKERLAFFESRLYETRIETDKSWAAQHIRETEIPMLDELTDIIIKDSDRYGSHEDQQPGRIDKVEFIETIINMSHRQGPFLANICDYKENHKVMMGDNFGGIITEILDCLFDDRTKNPDMVAERMLNR